MEQTLESAPARSPQQEVFSSLLDEVSQLKAIVQKLLLLSLVIKTIPTGITLSIQARSERVVRIDG